MREGNHFIKRLIYFGRYFFNQENLLAGMARTLVAALGDSPSFRRTTSSSYHPNHRPSEIHEHNSSFAFLQPRLDSIILPGSWQFLA